MTVALTIFCLVMILVIGYTVWLEVAWLGVLGWIIVAFIVLGALVHTFGRRR